MRVVFFGGSFNPPTIAHYEIIKYLATHYDKVLICPNRNDFHYKNKTFIEMNHRIAMLNLLINDFSNVEIYVEDKFEGSIKTLRDLHHPIFVVGSDVLPRMKDWIDGVTFIKENMFLVLKRNNDDILALIRADEILKYYESHFEIAHIDIIDSSSTNFRLNKYDEDVTKEVLEYIHKHNLYAEN